MIELNNSESNYFFKVHSFSIMLAWYFDNVMSDF